MTDEQIKQSAEIYARYNSRANNTAYYAYIDGAHSRDEEVEQLKKAISSAQKAMAELAEIARHPWISVEERLPEIEDRYYLVHYTAGNLRSCLSIAHFKYGEFVLMGKATHWMPIPELKGGEK